MKLSCEQEALRSVFTKKWLDIAFSENNIDRDRAKKLNFKINSSIVYLITFFTLLIACLLTIVMKY